MDNGVEVRFFAAARAAAGVDQARYPSSPLSSIIADATRENPLLAHVIAQCSFLLDSVAVHDVDILVLDGSVIDVLPKFAGG